MQRTGLFIIVLGLLAAGFTHHSLIAADVSAKVRLPYSWQSHRLDSPERARLFSEKIDQWLKLVEKREAEQKEAQKQLLGDRGLETISASELTLYFRDAKGLIAKRDRKGLQEIR